VADAERLYREELEQFADNGRARFNLAQLARQRGDQAAFLAELRASTVKAPEFGPAFFFLAREELRAGRLDAAADLARKGLDVDRRSRVAPLGHYVLADVYNRQGKPKEAAEEVAKARRIESGRRTASETGD
jgi:tetratricopeptide (TPR) repeat protein